MDKKEGEVEPGRVELPSKRATARLSTCLVYFRILDHAPVVDNQVVA